MHALSRPDPAPTSRTRFPARATMPARLCATRPSFPYTSSTGLGLRQNESQVRTSGRAMGEESTDERLEAAARQATFGARSDDLSKRVETQTAMAPVARKALWLLQVLVAVAMVAWVCTQISLSDRAERRQPDGKVVELRYGRAESSVEGDVIRIRDPAGPVVQLRKADGWQVRPGLLTLLRDLRPGLYAAALLLAVA